MKAIGYIRVSTEDQAREGVSLEAQEAKIRAWADLNGYAEIVIYADAALSGKRADNRPGLQKALAAIGKGEALVVHSLSRLARSTRDTLEIADSLARRGADLVSISERIDTTTAAGKMVFRMLAVLNEFERDQVAERTRTAMAHMRRRGRRISRHIPYGYDCPDGRRLVDNPAEQKALKLMKRLKRRGLSLRRICRRMEKEGHRTKGGGRSWHPQTVKQILDRAA